MKMLAQSEWAHTWQPQYVAGSKHNKKGEANALSFIARIFADRPDLRSAVTPQYPFSGKRRVLSDDFYPTLLRDNVELVPHAVKRLTASGIVDATDCEREVDVIVAATGFKASTFLSSLEVTGRGARRLDDLWRDGAYAYLGIAVPDFPNFYMMYGPNTNGGAPITMMHDQQAAYIIGNLRWMMRKGVTAIDVKPSFLSWYQTWIQSRMKGTAWLEANNYFKGPQGQIVTQWRDGLLLYAVLTRVLRRLGSVPL
jgi:cation diffusion facilitator CzcD-associated flavoprotein CzcO